MITLSSFTQLLRQMFNLLVTHAFYNHMQYIHVRVCSTCLLNVLHVLVQFINNFRMVL